MEAARSDQIPFSMQTSDIINGQLVAVSRREAWAPVAWGPTPGQSGGFSPVPTIPPSVGPNNYGVMGSQAGGFSAGIGQHSEATNMGIGGYANSAAAGAAALYPWNWKLSPVPWAILFVLVGLIGLRLVHWK